MIPDTLEVHSTDEPANNGSIFRSSIYLRVLGQNTIFVPEKPTLSQKIPQKNAQNPSKNVQIPKKSPKIPQKNVQIPKKRPNPAQNALN